MHRNLGPNLMPPDPNAVFLAIAALGMCAEGAEAHEADLGLRGRFELSSNVAIVSDYRGRGLSVSNHQAAIQGGFDIAHESGFSGGLWASSMAPTDGATLEVDLYAARTFELGSTELAIGATAFLFPGGNQLDYGELQFSASRALGMVDAVAGVNYVWRQANLGDDDNIYLYIGAAAPLGQSIGAPLTLNASFGHEEGALAAAPSKNDWSLGIAAELAGLELGATYVDTDIDDPAGDASLVVSMARTF